MQGRRVLLATSDPKERVSQLLGVDALSEQVQEVRANLWAVNIDASAALREYGELTLKAGVLQRAVFDNRAVQRFFAAIPGLHQWAILGKAWYHSTESTTMGQARFDHVIFDAPATGHALQMLWVPKIVTQVARTGFMARDAERSLSMLRDPQHTAVVLVSLAEEGPVSETLELARSLTEELAIKPSWGVVNSVLVPALTTSEREQLGSLEVGRADAEHRSQVDALVYRAASESGQQENLGRLRHELPIAWLQVPRAVHDPAASSTILQFASVLTHGT